jgi:hypothetical protein
MIIPNDESQISLSGRLNKQHSIFELGWKDQDERKGVADLPEDPIQHDQRDSKFDFQPKGLRPLAPAANPQKPNRRAHRGLEVVLNLLSKIAVEFLA